MAEITRTNLSRPPTPAISPQQAFPALPPCQVYRGTNLSLTTSHTLHPHAGASIPKEGSGGGGGGGDHQNDTDFGAVMYISAVLVFYSLGIVVMIVKYLKTERKEIEEELMVENFVKGMPSQRIQHEQDAVNRVAIRAFHTLTSRPNRHDPMPHHLHPKNSSNHCKAKTVDHGPYVEVQDLCLRGHGESCGAREESSCGLLPQEPSKHLPRVSLLFQYGAETYTQAPDDEDGDEDNSEEGGVTQGDHCQQHGHRERAPNRKTEHRRERTSHRVRFADYRNDEHQHVSDAVRKVRTKGHSCQTFKLNMDDTRLMYPTVNAIHTNSDVTVLPSKPTEEKQGLTDRRAECSTGVPVITVSQPSPECQCCCHKHSTPKADVRPQCPVQERQLLVSDV